VLSVIVPVLNERRALPTLLRELRAQPGAFEVVVVDGGSTDGTPAAVEAFPGVKLVRARRGRGAQMNAGARVAQGETLLFLHADTRLPAGAIARLQAQLAGDPRLQAGAFRHSFTPADWRLRLVSFGNNLRCRRSRVYFGDQAIFTRRSIFEQAGGFPEVPVLEDVIFCERLRAFTRAVLLDEVISTDARRFLHHGVWRTVGRGLLILARHSLGLSVRGRGYTDEVR
jgi:rSAM/selenodomain-associated transferase 2